MLVLTRWFGVTDSDAQRSRAREPADIKEIAERSVLMQSKAAAEQGCPLRRGTHAKGISVGATFEVFDIAAAFDGALAARLARGIFAVPGVYPAVVRFANSDSKSQSDLKPDVRSLSLSIDLTRGGAVAPEVGVPRQDFSLQNATTLPINDSPAFLAVMKLLTAANPAAGLWSLSWRDKLRVLRTLTLVQFQTRQRTRAYQQLRYWSTVPFGHGAIEVVKYSATPAATNTTQALRHRNPNALQDELIRHVVEDAQMSAFDFGIQLLDTQRMTYWGRRHDAAFWIENASVEWKESQAPFHTVARLTLLPRSQLTKDAEEASYFDVTGHSTSDSRPLGSINRARWAGEVASREARKAASRRVAPRDQRDTGAGRLP